MFGKRDKLCLRWERYEQTNWKGLETSKTKMQQKYGAEKQPNIILSVLCLLWESGNEHLHTEKRSQNEKQQKVQGHNEWIGEENWMSNAGKER